jgi:glycerol-3-phosphate dehydrogenase
MSVSTYDAVVVGGGATGTGLVRDLAIRGVRSLLIEQGDLCHGTSGRFHGLLHSGARYVVRDPKSARECSQENRVLRTVAPHTLEATGGIFCWLEGDPEEYPPRFLDGCRAAEIDVDEVQPEVARRREPLLTQRVARVFHVPDATINPFQLAESNIRSAQEHGAAIRRYTRLVGVTVEQGAVVGIEVEDARDGGRERIDVGALASAAGAWAGRVAELAGVKLTMAPGWGTMVIMNQRLCQSVVNRCRMPSDGDIVVPVGTVCIAGTTDQTLDRLEGYEIRRQEVRAVLSASAEMLPALAVERVLRVYAGARPVYDPGKDSGDARARTRAHTVLDHAEQGVERFVSVVGGKLTTYRLMAEHAADAVCRKLGAVAPCRTAAEPLPPVEPARLWRLGVRLGANEEERQGADADLVCECELVARRTVSEFCVERQEADLEDMLRGLRLGMGPCQGAFCSLRAAGVLEQNRRRSDPGALRPLAAFLEERLRGMEPALWGDGARQFRLNEIIYREVFALDHAPTTPV